MTLEALGALEARLVLLLLLLLLLLLSPVRARTPAWSPPPRATSKQWRRR